VKEFEAHFRDAEIADFRVRVSMVLDQEVDSAYPARWIGKVTVQTLDGRSLQGRVDEPKGDPGNTLTREELEKKALSLADFGGAATSTEMQAAFKRLWSITEAQQVGMLLMQS
jgi:2-methylcitrate dehydratase PrpD